MPEGCHQFQKLSLKSLSPTVKEFTTAAEKRAQYHPIAEKSHCELQFLAKRQFRHLTCSKAILPSFTLPQPLIYS